jgi:hypothetical protein
MLTDVAFVVVQVRVSGDPLSIVALPAVKVTVGVVFAVTVTVTLEVLVWPPDPVPVIVYVVVCVGETGAEPERGSGSAPTDGLILTLVALVLVQDNVALCPEMIEVGED